MIHPAARHEIPHLVRPAIRQRQRMIRIPLRMALAAVDAHAAVTLEHRPAQIRAPSCTPLALPLATPRLTLDVPRARPPIETLDDAAAPQRIVRAQPRAHRP